VELSPTNTPRTPIRAAWSGCADLSLVASALRASNFSIPSQRGSREEVLEQLRGIYSAIAEISAIRGVCFTELYEVEHELGGLMTANRIPKVDPKLTRDLNDMLR
jgi:dimeric dUTPase (all-alpha-NTP-PPase superfamily)